MANLAKITRGSVGNILSHFERKDGVKFGNIEIKPHLSEYNYNLAPKSKLTQREILEKRLSEVKVLNRKNVNVLSPLLSLMKTSRLKDYQQKMLLIEMN